MEPAGAATVSRVEAWEPSPGFPCRVEITNEWPYDDHETLARGRTRILAGSDQVCFLATAHVGGTWKNPSGGADQGSSFDDGDDAAWDTESLFAPVGSELVTHHYVVIHEMCERSPECPDGVKTYEARWQLQGNSK